MPDTEDAEQRVAWELHVELATRVAVVELPESDGLLSEALASLTTMAARCRDILGRHRPHPDVGTVNFQVEVVADTVLTGLVDPFTAAWSPRLLAWSSHRPEGTGEGEHERAWSEAARFRSELAELSTRLAPLADRLAELAGATSLVRHGE
jgi:hypothetical protein